MSGLGSVDACHETHVLLKVWLQALEDPMEQWEALEKASGNKGCSYCGGLGHRVGDCPKLHSDTREKQRKNKDYFGADGYGAEM